MQLLDTLLKLSTDAILLTSPDTRIVRVNPAFTRITGYKSEEVLGRKPDFLKSGRHDGDFYRSLWEKLSEQGTWEGEIWNRRKSGDVYVSWLRIAVLTNKEGKTAGYIGMAAEGPDSGQSSDYGRYITSHYDALTGLPNRLFLHDRLSNALALSRRHNNRFALLCIALDGLNSVNEILGWVSGDRVLQETAKRLQNRMREIDVVARVESDEFAVILTEVHNVEDIIRITRTLQNWLHMPFSIEKQAATISTGIGVAVYPDDGIGVDELFRHARDALKNAKQAGRGRICFYSQGKHLDYPEQLV